MAPQIIVPAKTLREQVISLSPQVKAAIITAGCTLFLSTIAGFWQWSRHAKENSALKQDLDKAAAKVQELEFELTPFRTLALEKFSRADAETLKKLAEQMTSLQK